MYEKLDKKNQKVWPTGPRGIGGTHQQARTLASGSMLADLRKIEKIESDEPNKLSNEE